MGCTGKGQFARRRRIAFEFFFRQVSHVKNRPKREGSRSCVQLEQYCSSPIEDNVRVHAEDGQDGEACVTNLRLSVVWYLSIYLFFYP
jgi:hypothetical protein